jgi:hypothetical protein
MRTVSILILCVVAGLATAEEIRPGPGAASHAWAIGNWTCPTVQYFDTPVTAAHRASAKVAIRAVLGGNVVQLDYQETSADPGHALVSVLDHVWDSAAGGRRRFVDSNLGAHDGSFEAAGDAVEYTGTYTVDVPGGLVFVFPFTETVRRINDASGRTTRFLADSRLNFAPLGLPITLTFQTLDCSRVGN